jgi:FkbM family methyltransferase
MASKKTIIKHFLYKSMPQRLKLFIEQQILNDHEYYRYMNHSFSQEGEDLILSQFFYGKNKGFFVDIGAHHPIQFSNTYKFYLKGWRGINMDAMPGSMAKFNLIRSEDINLELGISNSGKSSEYYMFQPSSINTFSKRLATKQMEKGYDFLNSKITNTMKLESVLDEHLPKNQNIDFLSVDVEGLELDALKSNNWDKYRPIIVLVESLELGNKIAMDEFFHQIKYKMIAQTKNNLFYRDSVS